VITVGVIGYGYWGPNLVRNFADQKGCRVGHVSDLRPERLADAARRCPGAKTSTDYRELIADPGVDAVVIATPVSTHFAIGMAALRAGKHVLIEKPLAATAEDAMRLVEEADRRGLVLLVDHTFVYTPAVQRILERDVNVLWDLAVHDLSIMEYVVRRQPLAVSATGLAHVPGTPENIAYMTMFFEGSFIAHVHANWLSPVKVRRTLLAGSRRMILFDDLEASDKVKVYDRGISLNSARPEDVYQMLIGYRAGDMWSPQLEVREALHAEAAHFVDCVEQRATPLTGGLAGVRVVRLLEAATESMANQGRLVPLAGGVQVA
jgi:predicted dehydrogenase